MQNRQKSHRWLYVMLAGLTLACNAVLPASPTPLPLTVTQAPSETPTATSPPAMQELDPTVTTTVGPSPTAITPPTSTPPPTSPPTVEPATLRIDEFTMTHEDLPGGGKRVTCSWATTGAHRVVLAAGTSRRFMPWWELPPNGTHTFELSGTLYRDPDITLTAYDRYDNAVNSAITLPWPCEYDYFFANSLPADLIPEACPRGTAQTRQGAFQRFQNGRMVWLKDVDLYEGSASLNVVFVLYDDATWERYIDTWTEGQPSDDPAIVPPEGYQQPIRGFGKVWRENQAVRDRLGWATESESAYEAQYQSRTQESLPSVMYLNIPVAIAELSEVGQGGTWSLLNP